MPTDRYTKAVLTIIAGALVVIAAQYVISQARGVAKVTVCDPESYACTSFTKGSLNVYDNHRQ